MSRPLACLCGLATAILSVALFAAQPPGPPDPRALELVLQSSHRVYIKVLAIEGRGRFILAGSNDSSARLWDRATGREVRTFQTKAPNVQSVAFSPDGSLVAVATSRHVEIFRTETGAAAGSVDTGTTDLFSLAFCRSNQCLAIAGGGHVSFWDVGSEPARRIDLPEVSMAPASRVAISDDDTRLAVVGGGGSDQNVSRYVLTMWDLTSQTVAFRGEGSAPDGIALRFNHGPRLRVVASRNCAAARQPCIATAIDAWDLGSGGALTTSVVDADDARVADLADTRIAFGSADSLTVVDASTAATVARTTTDFVRALAISADGSFVAASDERGVITVRGVARLDKTERRLRGVIDEIGSVQLSADGRELGTVARPFVKDVGYLHRFRIWNTATGEIEDADTEGISEAHVMSPDRRWLVVPDEQGELAVRDRERRTNLSLGANAQGNVMAFSLDSRRFATGGNDGVKVWRVPEWIASPTAPGLTNKFGIESLAFDASSRWLAVGGVDGSLSIRNGRTGVLERQLRPVGTEGGVWVVLFVPHTTWLAASAGRDIEMWDAATGAKVFELPGRTSAVQSLAISTDGRTLAAGDDAGEIWLWNLERRTPRAKLHGHKWLVSSLAFAPTTRAGRDVLVSASRDGSVGIWDPRTESRLLTLVALRDSNDWLAVTAEGLFDGTPDAMRKMYWRLGTSNTLAPIDAFFTEFYHPGLIGDIFEGLQPKPTRDLVSLLQTPGLRTMLLKGMARILPGRTGRRLCTDSPVTAAPSIYSDGVPYSLDLNALIKDPSDVECPNAIDLPANGQLELSALPVEARPLATEPPYDGQPSRVSQSTLHVRFFGISQYTLARNGLQPLSEGMTAFLTRLEGVFRNLAASGRSPFARVRVWDGLYDERAGRQAIRSGLEELIHAVGPDDVVLLYFAGHGLVPAGQEMFCFAPFDIAGPDPLTQMETGLTTAHLADVVRRLPARRIVLLIDACQSGGAVESLARIAEARVRAAARATRGVTPSPDAALGIYVITAATPLQRVLQSVNGMTVLSSAFSEAIGSATCQDGCTASVRDVIARIDAAYKRQNPEYSPLIQSFGVDFPLWRAAPP